MTYTSKESSEQVELEFLSKSIGFCMKNEQFGPDSDRHSDRRLSLPAQRQLQSLAEKLDLCFIPHLKALKGIYNFQCQKFRKL